MQSIYDRLFTAIKAIELANDPKERGPFSFTVHGKRGDQNVNYKFYHGSNEAGKLTWRPAPDTGTVGDGTLNLITDEDIANIRVQCDKIDVGWKSAEQTVLLFKAMQALGMQMPIFELNRMRFSGRNNHAYVLCVKGWLHDENAQPLGELSLESHVYAMSKHDKTVELLQKLRVPEAKVSEVKEDDGVPAEGTRKVLVLDNGHQSLTARCRT